MDKGSWLCTGGCDQNHPQEKEMQKGKMVIWGGLTNSWEKKRSKRQRRKGKIHPSECRVPKNSKDSKIRKPPSKKKKKERKKAFFSHQCKEQRKTIEWERLQISSRKLDTNGTFHAKMGTIKDRNDMELPEAEDIKKRWQEYTEELCKQRS